MADGDLSTTHGTATLHGRAESWECDFNGHWNTRFYCRSFDIAAGVGAALGGRSSAPVRQRHIRFHGEMHAADPFEIRSGEIAGDRTGHVMRTHGGRIAATALDDVPGTGLGALAETVAAQVLPRGLAAPPAAWRPDPARDVIVELGPVAADEMDGDALAFEPCVARLAAASHHHAMSIGYTHDFTQESGIGRMLVEMSYLALGPTAPGTLLRGSSRLTRAQGKSYVTAHLIHDHRGTPVALFELCTLAVDMSARRATTLPDFVLQAVIEGEQTP
ncbi:MAG: acyl-ACP thioesterase [Rhodobacteraceae bacterium]|uniref:Putative thioesterase n=1 Tax=Salipiger profundus TaxID=1229727 RepID=A0A1U7D9Z2_9RHOB|nr:MULTISPECIES: acyl-ACP thioesterase [Salipiger]APX24928.1 putative thioesterase [Salipiger profundus]MAB07841.1 acyl-ACP thioesterase [Paracoccaceae bacterium]GFZ98905.1 hypothetical protein GCM10011326_07850 [Salipiger profundus]SFC94879.1 Acyl-CoA thioesterase FadM [Salipiger profundus]